MRKKAKATAKPKTRVKKTPSKPKAVPKPKPGLPEDEELRQIWNEDLCE